jgi:DNA-binding MarR family transcriptional regulator
MDTEAKTGKATDPIDQAEELTRSVMGRLGVPVADDDDEGISGSKYRMMNVIDRFGPVSIGRIGTLVGSAQSTTSEMASRLMKAGLVEKVRGTRDGRVVTVTLTAEGRQLVRRRRRRNREALEALLGKLADTERGSFLDSLRTLDALFRRDAD